MPFRPDEASGATRPVTCPPEDAAGSDSRTHLAESYRAATDSLHSRLERVPGESTSASAFPEGGMDDSWRMPDRPLPWSCTDEEAMLLAYIIRANGLKQGFEVATAFGFSALSMGLALRDNGGHLVSMDCYVEEEDESLYYDTDAMAAACEDVKKRIAAGEEEPLGLKFAHSLADELGLAKTVTFEVGVSPRDVAAVLSKPDEKPPELDLVFIDGGHFRDQPLQDFLAVAPYLSQERCAVFFHDNNSEFIKQAVTEAERRLGTPAVRLPTRWNLTLIGRGLTPASVSHLSRLTWRGGGMASREIPDNVAVRRYPRGTIVGTVDTGQISVIVQGPIVGAPGDVPDRRVTKKCIDSIRHWLPKAEIILSTWENADTSDLDFDILVKNEDPGGVCFHKSTSDGVKVLNNVNRQIMTTRAGLLTAHGRYALKIRSDFFLKGNGFLHYFGRWRERSAEWRLTRERVLACTVFSRNPHRIFPFAFHPGDWTFFGLRQDVLGIWNIPLAPEPETSQWFNTHPRPKPDVFPDALNRYTPEQYVWVSFLRKHGNIAFEHQWVDSPETFALSEKTIANNLTLISPVQWQFGTEKPPLKLVDSASIYTHGDWLRLYRRYCAPFRFVGPDWERMAHSARWGAARRLDLTRRSWARRPLAFLKKVKSGRYT